MSRRNLLTATGAIIVTAALCLSVALLPNDTPEREQATPTTEPPTRYELRGFDSREELDQAKDDYAFALAGLWKQNVDFKVWTEAAWNAYQAELAAQSEASRSYGPSGAGGECGGATNGADAFIARESGGSSTVWNAQGSSAWGCYQIIDSTWASSCSDLGTHGQASAAAQAECASRLPLSAWSSSGPT